MIRIFRKRLAAQVTVELTISIFLALLLLVATARIFVWLNQRMVLRHQDYEATRIQAGSVAPNATGCTECCANINWIGASPPSCDQNAGNWRYFCMSYGAGLPPHCMSCVYADSWNIVPDSSCQSSVKPPERRCAQQGLATEIQVDETGHPRLNIFENWPSSR